MNRKTNETVPMLTNTAIFAVENMSLFPETSAAREVATALQSGINRISEKARARISAEAAMQAAQEARAASDERLRGFLTRASLIAQALHAQMIRIPIKPTHRVLIDTAHALVKNIESIPNGFAKYGVAPEDVRAAAEALENAMRDYSKAKAARSAAIEESGKALEEAMNTLKGLDALVAAYLHDHPGAMASYAIARSVRRMKARRTAAKESETAPAPAAPSTTVPVPHSDSSTA